jgi:wyosine [tRNA(Phe)-imidazoG37] synthetase (radical SAM superfamily)
MAFKPTAKGPVTSRRFGKSIVIINCPESVCTYSCIYCHGGPTVQLTYERTELFNPLEVVKVVRLALAKSKESRESFDYITFIPDGEPTQDINLGKELELLKQFGIKLGVMTNSSLLWRDDVRAELMLADSVSIKIDSLEEKLWLKTHRPHKNSRFSTIIEGIIDFAEAYKGRLLTETMLVHNHNDSIEHAELMGAFIKKMKPAMAYISIPTFPPTLSWVKPPDENTLNKFFQTVNAKHPKLEYLIGYEAIEPVLVKNAHHQILAVASTQPVRKAMVSEILSSANADWDLVKKMIDNKELVETTFDGSKYYVRKYKMYL